MMSLSKPSLFTRHDTFFGVCEALGQDFGFNPNWLRIGAAVALLLAPLVTLVAYVGLGIAVLASRLIFPARSCAENPAKADVELRCDNDAEPLSIAEAA